MRKLVTTRLAGAMIFALVAAFSLSSCASMSGVVPRAIPGEAGSPPVLEDVFAPRYLFAGQIWKIYVAGHDPDGDMKDFWVRVTQHGGNEYSDQFVPIRGAEKGRFSGYLALYTPTWLEAEGYTEVTAEIHVRDARGNYSAMRTVNVRINGGGSEAVPERWQGARQLGTIFFSFARTNDTARPFF